MAIPAPLIMQGVGLGLNILGIGKSRRASRRRARKAREAAEFEGKQLDRKAGEERAIGSRAVADQAREGERVASRARALGAASGAGGYEDVISDIEAESEYRALTALYNSEISARDLEVGAKVARKQGADAARAYREQGRADTIAGLGNIITGAASLYERYG